MKIGIIKIRRVIQGSASDLLLLKQFINHLRYSHEDYISKDFQDSLDSLELHIGEKVDDILFDGAIE